MVKVAFSPDGETLALLENSHLLSSYAVRPAGDRPLEKRHARRIANVGGIAKDLCFLPRQRQWAICWDDGRIAFYDDRDLSPTDRQLRLDGSPISLAVAGNRLVVGLRGGDLACFELGDLRQRWRIRAQVGHLNQIAAIPGSDAVATVGLAKALQIWDVQNADQRLELLLHQHPVFSVQAAQDGSFLVTGGLEGDVRLLHGNRKSDTSHAKTSRVDSDVKN